MNNDIINMNCKGEFMKKLIVGQSGGPTAVINASLAGVYEEAKKLGYDKAYLWTDKAPKFYEKIGFTYVKDVLKNDKTGYGRLYSIDI
jgi:N-acetylglutamate synthase-like GNAT family acetyltransferase